MNRKCERSRPKKSVLLRTWKIKECVLVLVTFPSGHDSCLLEVPVCYGV